MIIRAIVKREVLEVLKEMLYTSIIGSCNDRLLPAQQPLADCNRVVEVTIITGRSVGSGKNSAKRSLQL